MNDSFANHYTLLKPAQLRAALPPAWVGYQLSVVLLVRHLPSANEVRRGGKRLATLKTRWRSLSPLCEPMDPSVVHDFPGTKAQAILVNCPRMPPVFTTFASLLETPLGSWHDLQVFDRGILVAFSIREDGIVWVASGLPRVSLAEAYGERAALPSGLFDYLCS